MRAAFGFGTAREASTTRGPEEWPVEPRQVDFRALADHQRRVAKTVAHLHDTQAAGGSIPPASTQ